MKDFIRKVSFGTGPEEKVPTDPLNWAKNQLNSVPKFKWDGKKIYTEKERKKNVRETCPRTRTFRPRPFRVLSTPCYDLRVPMELERNDSILKKKLK